MGKRSGRAGEVVRAICDYEGMLMTIERTSAAIEEFTARMESPRSSVPDGLPHAHNPQAGENRIVHGIELLDDLRKRLLKAEAFVTWFESAWYILPEEDRELLETLKYAEGRTGILAEISERTNYSERQLFRRRNRALESFETLLFGY